MATVAGAMPAVFPWAGISNSVDGEICFILASAHIHDGSEMGDFVFVSERLFFAQTPEKMEKRREKRKKEKKEASVEVFLMVGRD